MLTNEYFATIRDIWILLALCFATLVFLTFLSVRRYRRIRTLRQLGRAESGASYSISMVLTMPIYTILICMIVECTLTLQVKIGTLYAAHAAARSAAVWCSTEVSQDVIDTKIKTAAVQAIAPFASSQDKHLRGIGGESRDASALHEAYSAYCGGPITDACLAKKLSYAWHAVDVVVVESSSGPNANLSVTVKYQMPFHTAIGYLIGGRKAAGGLCLREIQTTVTMQKEGVKSPTQTLGISYDPDHSS